MAAPFGIDPLRGIEPLSIATYTAALTHPPKPHPDLKNYSVSWSEFGGIHQITGESETFDDGYSCDGAQEVFQRLKVQLETTYGKDIVTHQTRNDDEFWQDVIEGNDQRISVWVLSAELENEADLACIILAVECLPDVKSKVRLSYQFQAGFRIADKIAAASDCL